MAASRRRISSVFVEAGNVAAGGASRQSIVDSAGRGEEGVAFLSVLAESEHSAEDPKDSMTDEGGGAGAVIVTTGAASAAGFLLRAADGPWAPSFPPLIAGTMAGAATGDGQGTERAAKDMRAGAAGGEARPVGAFPLAPGTDVQPASVGAPEALPAARRATPSQETAPSPLSREPGRVETESRNAPTTGELTESLADGDVLRDAALADVVPPSPDGKLAEAGNTRSSRLSPDLPVGLERSDAETGDAAWRSYGGTAVEENAPRGEPGRERPTGKSHEIVVPLAAGVASAGHAITGHETPTGKSASAGPPELPSRHHPPAQPQPSAEPIPAPASLENRPLDDGARMATEPTLVRDEAGKGTREAPQETPVPSSPRHAYPQTMVARPPDQTQLQSEPGGEEGPTTDMGSAAPVEIPDPAPRPERPERPTASAAPAIGTADGHAPIAFHGPSVEPTESRDLVPEGPMPQAGEPPTRLPEAPPPGSTPAPASDPGRSVALQLAAAVTRDREGTFEVRLSPEELGAVKLTLHVTDGTVAIALQAERPETLDLMRRSLDVLEREFRDAGFTSLNLSFGHGGGGRTPQVPVAYAANVPDRGLPDGTRQRAPASHGRAPSSSQLDIRL